MTVSIACEMHFSVALHRLRNVPDTSSLWSRQITSLCRSGHRWECVSEVWDSWSAWNIEESTLGRLRNECWCVCAHEIFNHADMFVVLHYCSPSMQCPNPHYLCAQHHTETRCAKMITTNEADLASVYVPARTCLRSPALHCQACTTPTRPYNE